MEKITKREMFEAIAQAMETGEIKFAPEVVIDFCNKEIEALDKKAAKAKERAAAKKAEADTLMDAVVAVLDGDEFQTIADIAAKIEDEDATTSKITYRLTTLVKNGQAEKSEVTVPGKDGAKARKVMAYRLIG